MAKHLNQSQIKAGHTIFVVHPKFKNIEVRLVTERPKESCLGYCIKVKVYQYFPIGHHTIINCGGIFLNYTCHSHYRNLSNSQWKQRTGYCGDDGIPEDDGVFRYPQQRRVFKKLKHALKYWKEQQTEANFKKWAEEDLETTDFFGDF